MQSPLKPFDIPPGAMRVPTMPSISPARLSLPRPRRARRTGRKALWTPRAVSEADLNRGAALLQEWGPDHRSKDRIVLNFDTMCMLSGLDKKDPRAAIGLLGQMANSGLGPGSTDVYIGYIHKRYRFSALYDVLKAAAARHANHESRHAPDVSDDILWQYVEKASPQYRPILYLLYVAGLRPRAIRFLTRKRMYFPSWNLWQSEDIEISVYIDKTRKKRALRAILSLPKNWTWIKPPPHKATLSFLQEGDRESRLWEGVTATHITSELKKMSEKHGLPRATTYSFRRGYINRIRPLVRNKKHLTEFTLHFDVSTVDAFYRRTKEDIKKMNQ